jgi:hypothetical protein
MEKDVVLIDDALPSCLLFKAFTAILYQKSHGMSKQETAGGGAILQELRGKFKYVHELDRTVRRETLTVPIHVSQPYSALSRS